MVEDTSIYCSRCRLGRLDAEGICALCGAVGAHVGWRTRWALATGQFLASLNLGLIILLLVVIGVAAVVWLGASWLATVSPRSDQVPPGANELLASLRADPGAVLLEMVWRAFVRSVIATAIIVAVGFTLWKRRQRRPQVQVASQPDDAG